MEHIASVPATLPTVFIDVDWKRTLP
jgi:hypothetical protein